MRLILAMAVILLPLAGCAQKPADQPPPPLPVEVVTGQTAAGEAVGIACPAIIGRDREAAISLRVSGPLSAIPARIGDRYQRGQMVARIDATPFQAAQQRAQADVDRLARAVGRNDALLAAGAIGSAERDDARSALTAARAALNTARYDATSAVARMPFNGVILTRSGEIGETVAAGQTLLTVADLSSPLLARVAVPPGIAARLRPGGGAMVHLAGGGDPVTARIRRIGAASDRATGTVQVELTIDGAAQLASGTVASARFPVTGRRHQAGASYPAEVLLDAQHGWGHVYVVDARRSVARRVRVRIVAIDGDGLRLAGLSPDARVISAGAGFVSDGQRVAIAAP